MSVGHAKAERFSASWGSASDPLNQVLCLGPRSGLCPRSALAICVHPQFFDLASPLIASSTETEQHDKEYSEDMNILKSGVTTSQYFTNQQCICS